MDVSVIDTLITTRAEPGAYGKTDLNRVASAMAYLSQRFASAGYSVPVSSPTDWANGDIPTKGDLDTYLDDLRRIRAALAVMDTTPAAPESMDYLTWAKANDIEKILVDVDDALGRLLLSPFYSGEIYSGEV